MNLSSRSLQTLDDARALALFGLKLQSLLLSLNGDREKEKESRQEVGKKKKKKKNMRFIIRRFSSSSSSSTSFTIPSNSS